MSDTSTQFRMAANVGAPRLKNFVAGGWIESSATESVSVKNPATAQTLAEAPLSTGPEVEHAVAEAEVAFRGWRRLPANERAQYLFRYKALLESHLQELTETITLECGKTHAEARAELRRGIENVEVACGIATYLQGWNNEEIAAGVDEHLFRQPLGVTVAITPFNFPAMIPLWFLPYAIACGNSLILKPSERVPQTSVRLFELLRQTGLPAGVAQLLHGSRETVNALVDHPAVKAVSFVGSSAGAKAVYARAALHGKRVQCQGGAKNAVVIMPDADIESTTQIIADSAFGCAGQRCLAASLAIVVGASGERFCESISEAARSRKVGFGGDAGVEMGPLISSESQQRVENWIAAGNAEGARLRVDGRNRLVAGYDSGYFIAPTVLDGVSPVGQLARTEVFGPVLGLIRVSTLDEAIELINRSEYGNMSSLFTRDGGAARKFRLEVEAGNIGINIGIAAPMAYYPFSGAKGSFLGDLHAQGRHGVEFYTQTKVVVERWPTRLES